MERHPDTGAVILGNLVPQWERVTALCMRTASLFPGLTMQAWDIAVCPEGPIVIEANVGGDFNLPQLAAGAGLLDERFERFLREGYYVRRWPPLHAAMVVLPFGLDRLVRRLERRT